MELEDKIRFALSTIRPMAEYTLPYLASVVGVLDRQTGSHVGSAFRCVLEGRPCIVTAAHVVAQATAEYPGWAVSAGHSRAPILVTESSVRAQRDMDLAILSLPESYPTADDIGYWSEDKIDRTGVRRETDYLFVHGFPGARSYSSKILGGVVNKSLPYGVMQRAPAELGGVTLKPFEFALSFDTQQIRVEPGQPSDMLPDPHGLSGSPVWRIGASGRSATDWRPDWALLVGVVTQWRPDAAILVATAAESLLTLSALQTT